MSDKAILRAIYIVSALVFIAVSVLFMLPNSHAIPEWGKSLPLVNSVINGTCAVLLVISFLQIKKGNIALHKKLNIAAFILSALFLLSYVTFHSFGVETKFGDMNHDGLVDDAEKAAVGGGRLVYLFILLTHILLAAIVLPLVLLSFYRGITNNVPLHRKIVRWSFPIWLYVTITGVVVYLMIKPYYSF